MNEFIKILLVEDDKIDRAAIERQVKKDQLPYDIVSVNTVADALAQLQKGGIDLALIDHKLPDGTGLDVQEQAGDIPCIFITGETDQAIAVKAMKAGAYDFLVKDSRREYLQLLPTVIQIALKRRQTQVQMELQRRIIGSVGEMILLIDETGELVYVNAAVENTLGYKKEKVLGSGLWDLMFPDPERRLELRSQAAERARGEKPPINYDLELQHKDGNLVWTSWTESRAPEGLICVGRDITQRKQNEKAVIMASRMEATTTLAGGIAHDFNNLMFGVLGNAELLKKKFMDRSDAVEMLDSISNSALQSKNLAQQILDYSRGGKYHPQVLDLSTEIQKTLHFQERSFPPGIQIEHDFEPNLMKVEVDPAQMSEIIVYICQNAIEAVEDKGHIKISLKNVKIDNNFSATHPGLNPGSHVCLSIEDDGCGMNQQTLDKVFEPFFTTKFQGRGLGLSAVYGIVKNHNGYISIESEEGRGALVNIYLPAVKEEIKKPLKPEPTITQYKGNETILLIDDDKMVIEIIQQMIKYFGYKVLTAKNGKEAVEIARSFKEEIHLAILDMVMPVMDGAEAYPLLKEARPNMKVIVCSSYELDEKASSVLDSGADAFFPKPFCMNELGWEIRKVLDS
jgi:PAS domain S-box-containing protein